MLRDFSTPLEMTKCPAAPHLRAGSEAPAFQRRERSIHNETSPVRNETLQLRTGSPRAKLFITLNVSKTSLSQMRCGNVICISNTSFHLLGLCDETGRILGLYVVVRECAALGSGTNSISAFPRPAQTSGCFSRSDGPGPRSDRRSRSADAAQRTGSEKFGPNYDDSG